MSDENVAAALSSHATALSSVDPCDGADDLAALPAWVGDADVVGLGEATHGTRECFAVRHRLTRHLLERAGVRTVALEAEAGSVAAADDYVRRGDGDPESVLGTLRPWWRTEGMAAFLRWLRAVNEERPAGDRVGLYGVDVGDPTGAATAVRATLRETDPDCYRDTGRVLDALAAGEARERGREDPPFLERAGRVLADAADRIERSGANGDAARVAYLARAAAGSCEWYRAGGAAEGFDPAAYERRDGVMADDVGRLAHRREGGVVFWGHNGHVKRGTFDDGRPWSDRETAGERLDREFGDGYRPVGTEFASGRFRAIHAGRDGGGYDTFEAAAPPDDAVAGHLRELGTSPLFLDLAAASADPGLAAWFDRPRRVRNVEAAYDPGEDHDHVAETPVAGAFDGLVFLEETRPSRGIGRPTGR